MGKFGMGKSIGGSKNPCLSSLLIANQPSPYSLSLAEVSENRDEIRAFLNYLKREIALEDISKENSGRQTMPFIKTSSFSEAGMAMVNLICLAKPLKDPETVKPTSAVILDNLAILGKEKPGLLGPILGTGW